MKCIQVEKLNFNNSITWTTFHSNFFSWKSYESFRTTFRTNRTRTSRFH